MTHRYDAISMRYDRTTPKTFSESFMADGLCKERSRRIP
jgi:hypothetical protein